MEASTVPSKLHLHRQSQELEIVYSSDTSYRISAEYLRVHSPSAEVRGHGKGQEVLQVGKKYVAITEVNAVGNYAIQLSFNDGHDTGIYSWDYLFELCSQHSTKWANYEQSLADAGASREPDTQPIIFKG